MALLSQTAVYIDSKEVPTFKHLVLNQQIDAHHNLQIVFREDMFENDATELGKNSKELLGKKIAIQISAVSESSHLGELEFNGIVTEIKIKKGLNTGTGDEIVVFAQSPTILADDGAHMDSFNEMSLHDIVSKIIDPYNIPVLIDPNFSETLTYSVQNNESSFAYLSRLSKQHGEWFYYNGEHLIFGKPEHHPIELVYGLDLHEFELTLIPKPQNFTYLSNDYLNDEIIEENVISNSSENQFNEHLVSTSNDIFPNNTQVFNNNNNSAAAKQQLNARAIAQQESIAIKQIVLKGKSSNPGVRLGNIVTIADNNYRITKINHSTNTNRLYQNEFEAVSHNPKGYPLTDINAFPKSASQVGIIKENNDPQGLGRVRVQFPWQKKQNKMSCWMRVVSMQAGGNGGMYRIPHKNDEVIVDFENGNAEVPYTSGSLYNANSRPPEGCLHKNNHFTVWKVGFCTITINEENGSITFIDQSNSSITLDGNGTVTLNAELNLNILALNGEINIDSPTINIGRPSYQDLTNIRGRVITIEASELLDMKSAIDLKAKGTNTEVTGVATVNVEGTMVSVASTGITEIKGAIVKMN